MTVLIIVLSIVMAAGALAVLFQKSLKNAVIMFGIVSLISVVMFVLMKAWDVAVTEASIGAVLTTAIFFFALRRIGEINGDKGESRDGEK